MCKLMHNLKKVLSVAVSVYQGPYLLDLDFNL